MSRWMAIILLVSLLFVGISLQPFDVSHPLSVTKECVQALPVCSEPILIALYLFVCVVVGVVIVQKPPMAIPLHEHQFYDPQRTSPILVALRRGKLAARFYN